MIFRRRHTANFTTIGNALFNDERLALDEVGLMSWLLSRPNDWEIRRPALMRRFGVGRDGLRRIIRALIRYGWIRAKVTRMEESGRVHVIYEVRDEAGPELSEDEARAALSLVSSGAAPGEGSDDDGDGDGTDEQPDGADPPERCGPPYSGEPEAAARLRQSHPGPIEELLKPDSEKTESRKGARAFSDIREAWPTDKVMSLANCERLHLDLTDALKEAAFQGIKPYLDDCKAQNRIVCDLATYYREKRWERFTTEKPATTMTVVKPGTPQWYRWREYRIAMGQSVALMDERGHAGHAWSVPSEWPPPLPQKNETAA